MDLYKVEEVIIHNYSGGDPRYGDMSEEKKKDVDRR